MIKIMDSKAEPSIPLQLSHEEKDAVSDFKIDLELTQLEVVEDEVPQAAVNYADQAKERSKKRRLQAAGVEQSGAEVYVDLKWVQSTSNIVERLFSKARLILTDYRKSMKPCHFELLLLLKCNRSLWSLEDLVTVESAPLDDEDVEVAFEDDH